VNRKQAVALVTELVDGGLVKPRIVVIDQRKPEQYQLKIKGDYNLLSINEFVKMKNYAVEEDTVKGYLLIFKP
jgi:hypothetical protein